MSETEKAPGETQLQLDLRIKRNSMKVAMDKAVTDGEFQDLMEVLDEIAKDQVASLAGLMLSRLGQLEFPMSEERDTMFWKHVWGEALQQFAHDPETHLQD